MSTSSSYHRAAELMRDVDFDEVMPVTVFVEKLKALVLHIVGEYQSSPDRIIATMRQSPFAEEMPMGLWCLAVCDIFGTAVRLQGLQQKQENS